MFADEGVMRRRITMIDAKDTDASCLKFLPIIPNGAELHGAAGREIRGIENEDNGMTMKVSKAHGMTGRILQGEVWRGCVQTKFRGAHNQANITVLRSIAGREQDSRRVKMGLELCGHFLC